MICIFPHHIAVIELYTLAQSLHAYLYHALLSRSTYIICSFSETAFSQIIHCSDGQFLLWLLIIIGSKFAVDCRILKFSILQHMNGYLKWDKLHGPVYYGTSLRALLAAFSACT